MKSAVIAPTGLLHDLVFRDSYHLCLAHLILDDKEYREFYQDQQKHGKWVILDNSMVEMEGKALGAADLRAAITILHPSEFVMADYYADRQLTYEWAHHYSPILRSTWPDMKLMAVPHWNEKRNPDVWINSLQELLPFCDTIGVPKFLGDRRPEMLEYIRRNYVWRFGEYETTRMRWEYHLLGTTTDTLEVQKQAKENKWIRGVDSKLPVRAAQAGVLLDPVEGLLVDRHTLPELDFANYKNPFPLAMIHNIGVYKRWADGT